jgi:hypothetical protein
MKHTLVCVLKSGGQYTSKHVERLRAQTWYPVVCLTDDISVTEPKLPLTRGLAGWWSKLEVFDHDFGAPVCYLDLDVVVQNLHWLNPLEDSSFYGMEDAFKPDGCPLNSSVMVWDGGPRKQVFDGLSEQEMQHPGGDQQWIWRKLGEGMKFLEPPSVVSYKKHGKAPEFGVVVYHGKPKPWDREQFEHELVCLFPASQTNLKEQFNTAWGALHTDIQKYSAGQRAHAKCWLTYRALDGKVTYGDWLQNVANVALPPMIDRKVEARWHTSQLAAEVFLNIQQGKAWQAQAKGYIATAQDGKLLAENPGAVLNLVRVGCLLAYQQMMDGQEDEAAGTVNKCFQLWTSSWGGIDPLRYPFRFIEMRQDSAPLYAMARIMHKLGRIKVYFNQPDWAEKVLKEAESSHWWKSMLLLGKHRSAIW